VVLLQVENVLAFIDRFELADSDFLLDKLAKHARVDLLPDFFG
jgi:hypothetical protein